MAPTSAPAPRPARGTTPESLTDDVYYLCLEALSLEVERQPSGALIATDPDTGKRMLVVVTALAEGEG